MDKPFKIGIWIDNNNFNEIGGGFSYTDRLLQGINEGLFSKRIEVFFVGFNLSSIYRKPVINIPYKRNFFQTKKNNFFHKFFSINLRQPKNEKINIEAKRILNDHQIEMVFYPNPFFIIKNFPYGFVNWDLGHKTTYAFPELSTNNEFNFRQKRYSELFNQALIICCESETGKQEVVNYFKINPDRIKILPMFAGKIIDQSVIPFQPRFIKEKTSFFIYPAQFWPHKNHYNLIKAFFKFVTLNDFKNYKLILPGSDQGNLSYINQTIIELGIQNEVIITGFIKNEELKWLYQNAVGLIFPSFLGPTNMPLLEALNLGCNVACSRIPGHVELLEDNAIYFDPSDTSEIFDSLISLSQKTEKTPSKPDNFNEVLTGLENIIIQTIPIRRTWGQNI